MRVLLRLISFYRTRRRRKSYWLEKWVPMATVAIFAGVISFFEQKRKKKERKKVEKKLDIRTDRWITQLHGENRTRSVCLLVVSMNILFDVMLQTNVRVETRIDKRFVKMGQIMDNSKRLLSRHVIHMYIVFCVLAWNFKIRNVNNMRTIRKNI